MTASNKMFSKSNLTIVGICLMYTLISACNQPAFKLSGNGSFASKTTGGETGGSADSPSTSGGTGGDNSSGGSSSGGTGTPGGSSSGGTGTPGGSGSGGSTSTPTGGTTTAGGTPSSGGPGYGTTGDTPRDPDPDDGTIQPVYNAATLIVKNMEQSIPGAFKIFRSDGLLLYSANTIKGTTLDGVFKKTNQFSSPISIPNACKAGASEVTFMFEANAKRPRGSLPDYFIGLRLSQNTLAIGMDDVTSSSFESEMSKLDDLIMEISCKTGNSRVKIQGLTESNQCSYSAWIADDC